MRASAYLGVVLFVVGAGVIPSEWVGLADPRRVTSEGPPVDNGRESVGKSGVYK